MFGVQLFLAGFFVLQFEYGNARNLANRGV